MQRKPTHMERPSSETHSVLRGKGLFTDVVPTHASMSRAPEEADLCIANFPKNTEENRPRLLKTSLTGSTEKPLVCSAFLKLKRKGWLEASH